jgi:pimeloyl-ACP methyl ester carboxylesterase
MYWEWDIDDVSVHASKGRRVSSRNCQAKSRPSLEVSNLETNMKFLMVLVVVATMLTTPALGSQHDKLTILLVHGAFADASSWNGVISRLERDGYRVIAVANPLRSLRSDAQYVSDIANGSGNAVVLVGHSYGGSVITSASAANVKALVYVAGFAPDVGETASGLSAQYPGSTLGDALAQPVALAGGGKDLYIQQSKFHEQFAADVSPGIARAMAAGQRPVTEAALNEPASGAAWKTIPSWFIYGKADRNIPAQAQSFMAARAKSRHTEVVPGASHAVMVSNPQAVAEVVERAARDVEAALNTSLRR